MAITVTAYPHEGHDQYYRCGQRWLRTPLEVKVVDAPKGEYEVTAQQLEILRKDPRLKVEGVGPTLAPPRGNIFEQTEAERAADAAAKAKADADALAKADADAAAKAKADDEARRAAGSVKSVRPPQNDKS